MTEWRRLAPKKHRKSQVDTETTEKFIAEKHIGERIKRLRLKKSMGLVELGKHTGLSASFLSQLETGRVVPTLRNLARIAMVFSKDLSYFFEANRSRCFACTAAKSACDCRRLAWTSLRTSLRASATWCPTGTWTLLRRVHTARDRPKSRGRTCIRASNFFISSTASLNCTTASTTVRWRPGTRFISTASTPHSYICAGKQPADALIVTMHQPPASQPVTLLALWKRSIVSAATLARAGAERVTGPARAISARFCTIRRVKFTTL